MKWVVAFEKITGRLAPPRHYRLTQAAPLDVTYGGGEANAAAALAGFGVPAAHVTCFPNIALCQAAAQLTRRYGVDLRHTVWPPAWACTSLKSGPPCAPAASCTTARFGLRTIGPGPV